LPLAASTVLQSSEIGTVWPPTNPSDTTARRKGHGLLGETAGPGAVAPLATWLMLSSAMALNPEKYQNSEKCRLSKL
jgi:hypothetical protein